MLEEIEDDLDTATPTSSHPKVRFLWFLWAGSFAKGAECVEWNRLSCTAEEIVFGALLCYVCQQLQQRQLFRKELSKMSLLQGACEGDPPEATLFL